MTVGEFHVDYQSTLMAQRGAPHNSTTDMICFNGKNEKVLVEIEYKLSNLFKHDHPYDTFDYVVCWSVDLDINEKKRLRDGKVLCLIQEKEEWILKYGTSKAIPIIEMKTIINMLKDADINKVVS